FFYKRHKIVSAPVWYLGRRYQIVRQKRPA
ncbi:respiratory nitrate reductase subunit gamma, partial [Pseudomonas aeruginosa]